MKLKFNAKCEEKMTLGSKNDMRNLVNFNASICTLMCYFCQEHIKFQLKKHRGIISHDTEKRSKLWRKTPVFVWKMTEVKLFPRCSLLVARCLLLVTFCSLLVTFCSLLVTFWSLLDKKFWRIFFLVKVNKRFSILICTKSLICE